MKPAFETYRARSILNVHKVVDGGWFWDKYTARPYIGCRSDCAFCYARGGRYAGSRDVDRFASQIRVKQNAVELLRRQLARRPRELICAGDWQLPAEREFRLSRGMLEVVRELGFPLLVIERSPALLDDIDLLAEINRESSVQVLISISSLDPAVKRAFEPKSPGVRRRLQTIRALADRGIAAGCALMPILPVFADSAAALDEVIAAVADAGGRFVVAGGLTLSGHQAERTRLAARSLTSDAALLARFSEPASKQRQREIRAAVRRSCERRGIADRMPRPIVAGPLAGNKRIAERLFLEAWRLELEDVRRSWAYRRAAWTVDALDRDLAELVAPGGETRLRELPNIGASIARRIAGWLGQPPTR